MCLLQFAPILFVFALTHDPKLLDELVEAVLEVHRAREEAVTELASSRSR